MSKAVLSIELEGALADDVRAAAQARGLSPEDYVRQQLAFDVALDADVGVELDWEEDLRRLEEPGEDIPAEQVFAEIEARLAARLNPPK
ncbi:MAG: hypothetical protein ABWZ40_01685 [Caulobacterales bacterium]